MLAPLEVLAFWREDFAVRARLAPGPAERHADLFGWSALERILNSAPAPHPALRLYQGAAGFAPPADASEAIRLLRAGAGLILEDAERYDPALGALVDRLEAELDEPARINVYASSPGAEGFPLHADTHDVFVLQIAGQKRWRIAPPTISAPLFHPSLHPLPAPAQPTPYLETVLSPGDTLYVPRGHWHEASAVGEPSLHLTLAVFFTTGIDLLYHLADVLHADPRLRAAFPPSAGPAARELAADPPGHGDHLAQLSGAIREALEGPELLSGLRAARLARRSPRRPFAPRAHLAPPSPAAFEGSTWETADFAARFSGGPAHLDVLIPGRRLRFPRAAEPMLRWLFAEGRFSWVDLRASSPETEPALARQVIEGLLAEGVIRHAAPG